MLKKVEREKRRVNIRVWLAAIMREIQKKSTHVKSAAKPAPTPELFVGVLTDTKIRSASMIALSTSVEKNKFLPR